MEIQKIKSAMQSAVSISADQAAVFFKTGIGQYAENDVFMGVTVPNLRKIAKEFNKLEIEDLDVIIQSKINEERLLALIILVQKYKESNTQNREIFYQFYLQHLNQVNNWNLVDASAHLIMGEHLWDKDKSILITLSKSKIIWNRRISIVSTWYFIKQRDLEWTLRIATLLLEDKHDLIHKSVGWMLREVGKRNESTLISFLLKYRDKMPKTMFRYAAEKINHKFN